ncbi:hypothetical protein ACJDU8_18920 [Clostridium sp. WILCCON 0269]|uniref:Uncharacterized protein n=1 Tax=Candidatus Clostridium eludens TaxID=3381663 RepID=A0ABW8SP87_9CLOT
MGNKVGRPCKISDSLFKRYQMIYPDIRTRRGILNKHYEVTAYEVVEKMEDVKFLVDRDNHTMKETILIELGRLENEEDIKIIARYICDTAKSRKLTARQWVNFIRLVRRSKE